MRAAAILVVVLGSAVLAARAPAEVRWLCRPSPAADPCRGDQTTTYVEPDGSARVATPAVPSAPPVDCFYVYPTVSNQPTPNATQTADPEVRSIALYQAQRFSTRCAVYAPLYREVTAAGVTAAGNTHDTKAYETAFADVREAWRRYLRDDNQGRGVILIGHSQGSRMLRALIRREIDPDPAQRARLVAAIIPGANATRQDFRHVPACTRGDQPGCVISYSTFNDTPPDNARFGRTDTDPVGTALDLPAGPGTEVLCTDPTALSGSGGRLESLLPSEPFAPGVIAALLLKLYGGPPPSADTPWLQPRDHYTARCETANGARVLMIAPVGDARKLTPSPDDTWGVHLVDINIALGNLITVAGEQTRAWLAARKPLRVGLRARRHGALTATVTGPPGQVVRVVLRRNGRAVARRSAALPARLSFVVRRPGRYQFTVGTARSRAVRLTLR
jgi:hypothetical protein